MFFYKHWRFIIIFQGRSSAPSNFTDTAVTETQRLMPARVVQVIVERTRDKISTPWIVLKQNVFFAVMV